MVVELKKHNWRRMFCVRIARHVRVQEKGLRLRHLRGKVLVMAHPDFPEAGLQVGRNREGGRRLGRAALREAAEESGLAGLTSAGIVGFQNYDMAQWRRKSKSGPLCV